MNLGKLFTKEKNLRDMFDTGVALPHADPQTIKIQNNPINFKTSR